jgi:hypothetical protein
MKKTLLIVVSSFFSSILFAEVAISQSPSLTPSINAAPPSFPTAGQAFKKIYSGNLSVKDAQTQPWYESYDKLYKQNNETQSSDPAITDLLANLQAGTIPVDAAIEQFQKAQIALKTTADSVLSS